MHIDWGIVIVLLIFISLISAASGLKYWSNRRAKTEKNEGRSPASWIEITILIISIILLLAIVGWISRTLLG